MLVTKNNEVSWELSVPKDELILRHKYCNWEQSRQPPKANLLIEDFS